MIQTFCLVPLKKKRHILGLGGAVSLKKDDFDYGGGQKIGEGGCPAFGAGLLMTFLDCLLVVCTRSGRRYTIKPEASKKEKVELELQATATCPQETQKIHFVKPTKNHFLICIPGNRQ